MDHRETHDALGFYRQHWTLEILEALTDRPRRFGELQRAVGATHSTPINNALKRMIKHGLVDHPSHGDGVHYALTAKGQRILPLLEAFLHDIQWWNDTGSGQPPSPPPG